MTNEYKTHFSSQMTSDIETIALLDSRLLCCVFNTGLQLHDCNAAALMFCHPPSFRTVSTSYSHSFDVVAPAKAKSRMKHDSESSREAT